MDVQISGRSRNPPPITMRQSASRSDAVLKQLGRGGLVFIVLVAAAAQRHIKLLGKSALADTPRENSYVTNS